MLTNKQTNHTFSYDFVRLTGFLGRFFHWKIKKRPWLFQPKTIRNGQLCFEWDHSNMYQSGGAQAPTWTHIGQEQPSLTSLCKSKYFMFQLLVRSLLVVTSDLQTPTINFATTIHVPHNCSKSLRNQHFKMHLLGRREQAWLPATSVRGRGSLSTCRPVSMNE